jgi:hypothetical protein
LQAQALFGILQPVFAHANVQPGLVNPEIFQQWLGESDPDLTAGIVTIGNNGGLML